MTEPKTYIIRYWEAHSQGTTQQGVPYIEELHVHFVGDINHLVNTISSKGGWMTTVGGSSKWITFWAIVSIEEG